MTLDEMIERKALAERLTPRQREIVKLIVEGKQDKHIGAILGITGGTVKVHLRELRKMLGLHTRGEIAYHFYFAVMMADLHAAALDKEFSGPLVGPPAPSADIVPLHIVA